MRTWLHWPVVVALGALLIGACAGPEPAPTPDIQATAQATVKATVAAQATPAPTTARGPTPTAGPLEPEPTPTPTPTPSPQPTTLPTRFPTRTPVPTAESSDVVAPAAEVSPTPRVPAFTPSPPLLACDTPTPIPATTPATSGPLALVFDRSLPGGPITGTHVNMILYRFRITGLRPGDAIRSFSLQLPYPPYSACRPDGSDGVVLLLFPWALESGTHVVALELADGRRAEGTFEHVRTTPAGRPWPTCSPWLPRIEATLAWLSTPEGFCLIRFTDPADWPDPACAPCPPAWEIWCNEYGGPVEPCDGGSDRPNAELGFQGHEICHGHQVGQILDAGLYKPGGNPTGPWLGTPQGRAFLLAVDLVLADASSTGRTLPWSELGERAVEDFANICGKWAVGTGGGQDWLSNWPPLLRFAQEWLPK